MILIYWKMKQGERSKIFSFLCFKAYPVLILWGDSRTFMLTLNETSFYQDMFVCFSLTLSWKGGILPLKNSIWGGYIYVYIHLPSFIEGKIISWSIPPIFFLCLTTHTCCLSIEFSVTVSQLNFMYVSLVFMVFPCWDGRTLLLFFTFQETVITSGKNFSRRQRYVPALSWLISAIEGRKIVGLGEVSAARFLSVRKYGIVVKKNA